MLAIFALAGFVFHSHPAACGGDAIDDQDANLAQTNVNRILLVFRGWVRHLRWHNAGLRRFCISSPKSRVFGMFSGFGGRKGRNSSGKVGTAGVPSPTLGTGSPTTRYNCCLCDRSVWRFAQDDGFEGAHSCLRATISKEKVSSSFNLSAPPATETNLML